jgi:hypothetical protein
VIDPDLYLFPLEVNRASFRAERLLFFEEAQENQMSSKARFLYIAIIGMGMHPEFFSESQIEELCQISNWKKRTLFKYLKEIGDSKLTSLPKRIKLHTLN